MATDTENQEFRIFLKPSDKYFYTDLHDFHQKS